jgi:hypothetical protein
MFLCDGVSPALTSATPLHQQKYAMPVTRVA